MQQKSHGDREADVPSDCHRRAGPNWPAVQAPQEVRSGHGLRLLGLGHRSRGLGLRVFGVCHRRPLQPARLDLPLGHAAVKHHLRRSACLSAGLHLVRNVPVPRHGRACVRTRKDKRKVKRNVKRKVKRDVNPGLPVCSSLVPGPDSDLWLLGGDPPWLLSTLQHVHQERLLRRQGHHEPLPRHRRHLHDSF